MPLTIVALLPCRGGSAFFRIEGHSAPSTKGETEMWLNEHVIYWTLQYNNAKGMRKLDKQIVACFTRLPCYIQ